MSFNEVDKISKDELTDEFAKVITDMESHIYDNIVHIYNCTVEVNMHINNIVGIENPRFIQFIPGSNFSTAKLYRYNNTNIKIYTYNDEAKYDIWGDGSTPVVGVLINNKLCIINADPYQTLKEILDLKMDRTGGTFLGDVVFNKGVSAGNGHLLICTNGTGEVSQNAWIEVLKIYSTNTNNIVGTFDIKIVLEGLDDILNPANSFKDQNVVFKASIMIDKARNIQFTNVETLGDFFNEWNTNWDVSAPSNVLILALKATNVLKFKYKVLVERVSSDDTSTIALMTMADINTINYEVLPHPIAGTSKYNIFTDIEKLTVKTPSGYNLLSAIDTMPKRSLFFGYIDDTIDFTESGYYQLHKGTDGTDATIYGICTSSTGAIYMSKIETINSVRTLKWLSSSDCMYSTVNMTTDETSGISTIDILTNDNSASIAKQILFIAPKQYVATDIYKVNGIVKTVHDSKGKLVKSKSWIADTTVQLLHNVNDNQLVFGGGGSGSGIEYGTIAPEDIESCWGDTTLGEDNAILKHYNVGTGKWVPFRATWG